MSALRNFTRNITAKTLRYRSTSLLSSRSYFRPGMQFQHLRFQKPNFGSIVQRRQASGEVRKLIRQYGLLAFGVYCVVSSSVFCGCLYSVTYLGIDLDQMTKWFNGIRKYFGFQPEEKNAEVEAEVAEESSTIIKLLPKSMRNPETVNLITKILLAMAMTNLFLPVKLTLVAILTPLIARRVKRPGLFKNQ